MPAISMLAANFGYGLRAPSTNPTAKLAIVNIDVSTSGQTIIDSNTRNLANLNTNKSSYYYVFENGGYSESNNIQFTASTPNTNSTYAYNTVTLQNEMSGTWPETKELWIWVPSGATGNNSVIVTEQGSASFSPSWFDSHIEIVGGVLKCGVWTGSLTSFTLAASITRDRWHHVVWRYNGTTLDGFYDGVKVTGVNTTRNKPVDYSAGLFYYLGHATATNMGGGQDFTGKIGVFRFYNSALSDAQVVASWNADRGRFGV